MKLRYTVTGTAADNVPFDLTGEVEGDSPLDAEAFARASNASFLQLTSGKAVFGEPGKGCRGPYSVTKLVLEVVDGL